MKRPSLPRRRLLALAVPGLAAACSSPDPVLYTLKMKPGPAVPSGPRVVEVRDIGLANYLDRKSIVRSSANYKLEVMANDWWGEALAPMLSRVIVLGLAQRLPQSRVYAESGSISADASAVVGLNVQRLDLDSSGTLELVAQAAVEFSRPKRTVAQTFHISKTPPTPTVDGQVAATSEAVAELTDGLATMLHS